MSFVNKKIFGSDIDSKTKQKLELLQLLSGNELPDGFSLTADFEQSKYVKYGKEPVSKVNELINAPDLQLGSQFLSQRSPFARMWTSLGLSKFIKTDKNDVGAHDTYEDVQNALVQVGTTTLNEDEFIGKIQQNGADYGKYAVLKAQSLTDDKVYTVGTHNLNQIEGYSTEPMDSTEYMLSLIHI